MELFDAEDNPLLTVLGVSVNSLSVTILTIKDMILESDYLSEFKVTYTEYNVHPSAPTTIAAVSTSTIVITYVDECGDSTKSGIEPFII